MSDNFISVYWHKSNDILLTTSIGAAGTDFEHTTRIWNLNSDNSLSLNNTWHNLCQERHEGLYCYFIRFLIPIKKVNSSELSKKDLFNS